MRGALNASQLTVGGGAAIRFAQGAAVTTTLLTADGTDAAIAFEPEFADGTYGFTVSGYADVKGVEVGGADSSAGMTIYATASEATDANVVNWKFEDTRKFWTGATSSDPSVAGNWQGGEVPTAADDVVVMSPTRALTVSAEGFRVKSMTVMDGAVNFSVPAEIVSALVALDGAAITVDRPLRAGSVALLGTGAMTHTGPSKTEANGVDITTVGDFFIDKDASINADGKGYQNAYPHSDAEYGNAHYAGHGGIGRPSGGKVPPSYGSIICPTNNGCSAVHGQGGGKVRLVVGGTFTVNGLVTVNGAGGHGGACAGAGGSVWVTAGRMAGSGTIRANGGGTNSRDAGGRISLMLTAKGADFSDLAKATVTAYPSVDGSSHIPTDCNCGTIYRQTGDEAFGCGTVYIQNDPKYADTGCGTPLPSLTDCEPNELKKVKLVIGHGAGVVLQDNLTVRDIEFADDRGRLDLGADGYILTVKSPWHAYQKDWVSNAGEWTDGKKPNWSNIQWQTAGFVLRVR